MTVYGNTCKWCIILKQSPAPVLFGKRTPAALNRTPDPLYHSSILFIPVPDQIRLTKAASHDPNRTHIINTYLFSHVTQAIKTPLGILNWCFEERHAKHDNKQK